MLSDVEAWREMQEVAFEVGMTARKVRKQVRAEVGARENTEAEGGESLESNELERRQRDLLRELDELEVKYQDLFSLTMI